MKRDDDAEERHAGLGGQPHAALQRRLVRALPLERARVVALLDMDVARGIPDRCVDAVQDSGEHGLTVAQQAVEAAAKLGRLDLLRVRGAHRGHGIGKDDARLEEGESAVKLDPVEGERRRRDLQTGEERSVEISLEREVVDRHHARRRLRLLTQVQGSEARRPVVAVHRVRPPVERRARPAKQRRRAREDPEAQRVVVPVAPHEVLVGAAVALVELRAGDDDEVVRPEQPAFEPEQRQARHGVSPFRSRPGPRGSPAEA